MTAIEMFELSNDKNVKRILKEKSKFYLLNRINERCEKDIIRFIETKIPSEDTLKEVLPVAQEHHLTTVSAYILAELKNYSNEKNYSL